ncbi:Indole-3-glycerol phosphate synthase [Phycisphaerae bacterium RAS1]|nr:Indole-3-glycerol phosphate synthase [Phycisphaerae bacterium RAS1]
MKVHGVLAEILAHKRIEIERAKATLPAARLEAMPGFSAPPRGFYHAIVASAIPGRPRLIAEIKRSSPSVGVIQSDFDPVARARAYAAGGASGLSVLTDEKYFDGSLASIAEVKRAVALPVLRKDFIIDPYQVHEARAHGADAILLIAEALDGARLVELLRLARSLALDVLLEVHDRASLDAVIAAVPPPLREGVLLGINNRDLRRQVTRLETTEQLAPLVPADWPFVSESGVKTRDDVRRLSAAGACGLLIGETLMRSNDPRRTIEELLR